MLRFWICVALVLLAGCGGGMQPTPIPGAPQIACPADVVVRGIAGDSQPVTFSAPVVTGGSLPVSVTCTPLSGAAFPLATTPVNCTVRDATAREARCSFNVSVSGLQLTVTKFDAVGDSFTAGENGRPAFIDLPNAYPTKLQAAFDARYPGQGITVVNRGNGGDRVLTTLQKLPGFLATDRPGAVLLLSGYNDLNACGPSQAGTFACSTAIDDLGIGVRDCIRRTKESPVGVKYVFVSTLTPPGLLGPKRIAPEAIVQANTRIRQQVSAEGAILVDTYPLFVGHEAEYVDTDGLHLRPAGYQALADSFFAVIRATVPENVQLTQRQ
jgi:lysophospholipase L1-like esterase